MDNNQEWNSIKSQMNKITKSYDAKTRSDINDMLFKKTSEIMDEQSLSLIYDNYGNQLYEKTSDVHNYIKVQKSGFLINLNIDESKLIETETQRDTYNTDFINYGTFPRINKDIIKKGMIDTDFNENNNYLYKIQEQKERKGQAVKEGIDKVKLWFNTLGRKQIKEKNPNLKNDIILLQ